MAAGKRNVRTACPKDKLDSNFFPLEPCSVAILTNGMVRLCVIILIGVFQSADEEIKEMLTKETVTTVTTEPADNSGPSSPSSPITPVDDSELNLKPAENVATSTTVQDPVPGEKIDVATSATESLCTSTTESTQLSKEMNSNSVSECLVEINVSVGSGRNTPSPCPSTAGKWLGNFLHHNFFCGAFQ